ncbi:Cathepsin L.1 [Strongyloides ratti]|uniref:Cathepsin L-like n=1 Tax=Strongyloides ratti TaxID=34506 RepID=A0A090L9J9_STRRB|nr:Cathepsin L.1 [Strongyloides ratti]CEF66427.1 Cathepsin L.1 [Strongyloides ratti]
MILLTNIILFYFILYINYSNYVKAQIKKDNFFKIHDNLSWNQYQINLKQKYSNDIKNNIKKNFFINNKDVFKINNEMYTKEEVKFQIDINHISDRTPIEINQLNEFSKNIPLYNEEEKVNIWKPPEDLDPPDYVDWRERGYVTPVKNQLQCGSSYIFASIGSLEGQYIRKTGELISLSEQNILDCIGYDGCQGGWTNNVFKFIQIKNNIDKEKNYQYVGEKTFCKYTNESVNINVLGYYNIPINDEEALKKAVAFIGPISVVIDAKHISFTNYKNGIWSEKNCSTKNLSHAMLIVGYGSNGNDDYWIVKNSWSTLWGNNGYIFIARNKNNMCGIATMASFPIV